MTFAGRGEALRLAMAEPDPALLGAAERLRRVATPEVAAWALSQAALRRKARAKFPRADEMLFTADGLEQATREPVRRWRAERFAPSVPTSPALRGHGSLRDSSIQADTAIAETGGQTAIGRWPSGGTNRHEGLLREDAEPGTGLSRTSPALRDDGPRCFAEGPSLRGPGLGTMAPAASQAVDPSGTRGWGGRSRVVWDLGCGIGADAMALAEAGLEVRAVEADGATAEAATHNLALVGAGPAIHGLAEEAELGEGDAVFLDPARRTARGRTWNVADFAPSWDFVLGLLASDRFVCVKLGPGLPKELIPAGVQACWVSDGGDVVEVSLWNRLPEGPCAVLLPGPHVLTRPERPRELEVRPVGRYLIEPDGAVIRSGLLAEIAPGQDLWLLDEHIAYLSADEPALGPFGTCFEVLETHDFDRRLLRRLVRERGIGTLEIKKRGIDVDPAALRRELRPKGKAAATIVLARTTEGTKALFVRRV